MLTFGLHLMEDRRKKICHTLLVYVIHTEITLISSRLRADFTSRWGVDSSVRVVDGQQSAG